SPGTLAGDPGRGSRNYECGDEVVGQRRSSPEWQHRDNDLRASVSYLLHLAIYDSGSGRLDFDWNSAGSGAGDEAATISESRRCGGTRDRGSRQTATGLCAGLDGAQVLGGREGPGREIVRSLGGSWNASPATECRLANQELAQICASGVRIAS